MSRHREGEVDWARMTRVVISMQLQADHQRGMTQFRTGKPLRNVVEMGFNEQGVRDWIITDRFPLRDRTGAVVGLVGTIQSLAARRKQLAPIGRGRQRPVPVDHCVTMFPATSFRNLRIERG